MGQVLHRFAAVEKTILVMGRETIPFSVPKLAWMLSTGRPQHINGAGKPLQGLRIGSCADCQPDWPTDAKLSHAEHPTLVGSPVESLVTARNVRYSRPNCNSRNLNRD